jgi:hypothetical protein
LVKKLVQLQQKMSAVIALFSTNWIAWIVHDFKKYIIKQEMCLIFTLAIKWMFLFHLVWPIFVWLGWTQTGRLCIFVHCAGLPVHSYIMPIFKLIYKR